MSLIGIAIGHLLILLFGHFRFNLTLIILTFPILNSSYKYLSQNAFAIVEVKTCINVSLFK